MEEDLKGYLEWITQAGACVPLVTHSYYLGVRVVFDAGNIFRMYESQKLQLNRLSKMKQSLTRSNVVC